MISGNSQNTVETFTVEGVRITIRPAASAAAPIIYLNADTDETPELLKQMESDPPAADFTLAAVSGFDWNKDLSPWPAEAVYKKAAPFSGGADHWLSFLAEQILPVVEKDRFPSCRGIAGYSLAGLFALYALYHTDLFHCAASVSGSLWYPGFSEYTVSRTMRRKPSFLYLSLGDREALTRHPVMSTVRTATEAFRDRCLADGIPVTFELNPGNHFQDAPARLDRGIRQLAGHAADLTI